ncbi:hypothetical protein Q604_UNBC01302G0001, partial [human gut metagenome]
REKDGQGQGKRVALVRTWRDCPTDR